jgi:GT2 family glycosyltransferase/tetratricopeptide (TPR) repeat protein
MPRCLLGPATPDFARDRLAPGPRHRLFGPAGSDLTLALPPGGGWEELERQFPEGWRPDCLALWLSYAAVPPRLWEVPVPILGLAPDWNLNWHYYRHALPRCDAVLTDAPGAAALQRAGLGHAFAANLYGLGPSFGDVAPDGPRDIDLLFVGNVHRAVQRSRLPWLGRLARLAGRHRVVIASGVFGAEYRRLLGRAKLVFNRSVRGECNQRAFEAVAAGALLLQERENEEVPHYLKPGVEYAPYGEDDFEAVVEHYLTHDDEREQMVAAAGARLPGLTFARLFDAALETLAPEWEAIQGRAAARAGRRLPPDLAAGAWAAVSGGGTAELTAALEATPPDSPAAGHGRALLAPTPGQAAGHYAGALRLDPADPLAALNQAEALALSGRDAEAAAAAAQALAGFDPDGDAPDLPPYPPGFDLLRVEWEAAAIAHAGDAESERAAKSELIRWRLHALLADLTGGLEHYRAGAAARPDLPAARAALGCALARAGQLPEALPHLRAAVEADPFDRQAARALHQLLTLLGDERGADAFAAAQRDLRKAAPALVPPEAWFAGPPPTGDELASVIILAHNELAYTKLCLDSVLTHTTGAYELILVDNGSTDGTHGYFEEVQARPGPSRVEVIRNDQNRGFAAGVNQGLAAARGDSLVLLNNDTVVTPGWLGELVRRSLTDWPRVGLVGPVTNYTAEPQQVAPGYSDLAGLDDFARRRRAEFAGRSLEVPRLTGFCLLVRREALDAAGGALDERYGLGFFEDDDLGTAARAAGYRLLVALDVYVHHFGSRTFAGLGLDTAAQLRGNLEKYRAKWGEAAAAGYRLPGPPRVGGPKVSLCLIVKNEEHNLVDCLGPVRDAVDEVVVVDTGSTDRTREVAAALGARVIESPWQDSFSAARNASLDHAQGEWVFWMDADDRLDAANLAKLTALFAELPAAGNVAFVMKCVCAAPAGEPETTVDHVRLFRRAPRHRWDYRVHEQILPALRSNGAELRWSDVVVRHTGYADPALRGRKLERDLRLLGLEAAERPDDPFTLFNVGAVLRELGRPAEALPALERSLARSHPGDSIVRKLHSLVAQCHRELGRPAEALAACAAGRGLYPKDAELLFVEALLRREAKDLPGAEERLRELLAGSEGEHLASVAAGLRGYQARHQLALVLWELGRVEEAAAQWRAALAEAPQYLPAWRGLRELLAASGDREALAAHAAALAKLGPRGQHEAEALLVRAAAIMASEPQPVYVTGRETPPDAGAGRVLVLCPDNPAPSGGIRRLYRHADLLRSFGRAAFVVHTAPGFRCTWFANATPVMCAAEAASTPADVVVVPEVYGPNLAAVAPGVPKVIFNQNAYLTFRGYPAEGLEGPSPYRSPEVVAVFAVSEDNAAYLRFAFPGLTVRRLHYGIDPHFAPRPKRRLVTYMPRKNAEEVVQVLNLLRSRGALQGWELQALDGLPEAAVAAALAESAIFLSFGHPEGCPLPPLEAMACGCLVVGYHGRGGHEYFRPEFSLPVEAGDVVGFAKAAETVLRRGLRESAWLEGLGARAKGVFAGAGGARRQGRLGRGCATTRGSGVKRVRSHGSERSDLIKKMGLGEQKKWRGGRGPVRRKCPAADCSGDWATPGQLQRDIFMLGLVADACRNANFHSHTGHRRSHS